MKKPTFKENVDSFVTQTSKIIRFSKDVIEYIKYSHSIMQVTVDVKIKNKICNFVGWRAVHSKHRLPSKGGRRQFLKTSLSGLALTTLPGISFAQSNPDVVVIGAVSAGLSATDVFISSALD